MNGGTTGITRFLNDGDDMVAEYNSSGTLLRRYVHGTSAGDDPLVWFEGSGVADTARHHLYADQQGSIVAVTDSAGNETAIDSYDEYGIPDDSSAASLATKGRFRYTGQAWLPELGMYYYKARMYSPTLGRFMQTDPIGYGDGMNMYRYVHDDPINGTDPTGSNMYVCGIYQVTYDDGVTEIRYDCFWQPGIEVDAPRIRDPFKSPVCSDDCGADFQQADWRTTLKSIWCAIPLIGCQVPEHSNNNPHTETEQPAPQHPEKPVPQVTPGPTPTPTRTPRNRSLRDFERRLKDGNIDDLPFEEI